MDRFPKNDAIVLTKKGERYAAENAQEPRRAATVSYTPHDRYMAALADLERLRDEMIELLDRLQGDPDEEPALGAPDGFTAGVLTQAFSRQLDQTRWADGGDCDEREEGDGDLEPTLGSLDGTAEAFLRNPRRLGVSQERWAGGGLSDLEEEHDGREPQCEDEGAQCDDEGADTFDNELGGDDEPDHDHELCAWVSGEVDQTNHYLPGTRLTGIDYVDNAGRHPWSRADD